MSKKVIILIIVLILALAGYNYLYQDHRDIQKEQPEFTATSTSIHNEFSRDFASSEAKYNDKTLLVSGIVTEINQNSVTLDDKIFCQFNADINESVKLNSVLDIKGRVIGYDDLFEQIKLDQCSIINLLN